MFMLEQVVPNLVGVDIGYGMETLMIHKDLDSARNFDLTRLEAIIRKNIPCGFNIRKFPHQYVDEVALDGGKGKFNKNRARLSLGTLGGGNHFIEADRDDEGNLYIVIHSSTSHLFQTDIKSLLL